MNFETMRVKVRTANTLQMYPDFGADFIASSQGEGLSDALTGNIIDLCLKHKLGDGLLNVLNMGIELVGLAAKAKNEGAHQAHVLRNIMT